MGLEKIQMPYGYVTIWKMFELLDQQKDSNIESFLFGLKKIFEKFHLNLILFGGDKSLCRDLSGIKQFSVVDEMKEDCVSSFYISFL